VNADLNKKNRRLSGNFSKSLFRCSSRREEAQTSLETVIQEETALSVMKELEQLLENFETLNALPKQEPEAGLQTRG
jgi:hypothetical protein